jgi:uncharacterized protein YecE (DUF72 family)
MPGATSGLSLPQASERVAEETELHHGLRSARRASASPAGLIPTGKASSTPRFPIRRPLLSRDAFDTLEINSSFYRIPTARTTASWRSGARTRVPVHLKLYKGSPTSGRLPRTSGRSGGAPPHDAGVLGAALQFPWSFKNDPEADYLSATRAFRSPSARRRGLSRVMEPTEFYDFTERGVGFATSTSRSSDVARPLDRTTGPWATSTSRPQLSRLVSRRRGPRRPLRLLYSEELDPWVEKISEVAAPPRRLRHHQQPFPRPGGGQRPSDSLPDRKRKVAAPRASSNTTRLARSAEPDSPPQPRLF